MVDLFIMVMSCEPCAGEPSRLSENLLLLKKDDILRHVDGYLHVPLRQRRNKKHLLRFVANHATENLMHSLRQCADEKERKTGIVKDEHRKRKSIDERGRYDVVPGSTLCEVEKEPTSNAQLQERPGCTDFTRGPDELY